MKNTVFILCMQTQDMNIISWAHLCQTTFLHVSMPNINLCPLIDIHILLILEETIFEFLNKIDAESVAYQEHCWASFKSTNLYVLCNLTIEVKFHSLPQYIQPNLFMFVFAYLFSPCIATLLYISSFNYNIVVYLLSMWFFVLHVSKSRSDFFHENKSDCLFK